MSSSTIKARKPVKSPAISPTPSAPAFDPLPAIRVLFFVAGHDADYDGDILAGLIEQDLRDAIDTLKAGKPLPIETLRADAARLDCVDSKLWPAGWGFGDLLTLVLDAAEARL